MCLHQHMYSHSLVNGALKLDLSLARCFHSSKKNWLAKPLDMHHILYNMY